MKNIRSPCSPISSPRFSQRTNLEFSRASAKKKSQSLFNGSPKSYLSNNSNNAQMSPLKTLSKLSKASIALASFRKQKVNETCIFSFNPDEHKQSTLLTTPKKNSQKLELEDDSFWLGAGNVSQTPAKKQPKTQKAITHDRFIPRTTSDTSATFAVEKSASYIEAKQKQPSYLDVNAIAYQEEVAKACGVALDKRILAFNIEPPPSDHRDVLKANWNRPLRPPNSNLAKRKISTQPFRVLDAPGLLDDYYLNLLDWSPSNLLAIGLGRSCYIWNAVTGTADELFEAEEGDYICSVKFSSCGEFLSVGTNFNVVQIWCSRTLKRIRLLKGHVARVSALSWKGATVTSGARDGSIWNHDVRIAKHKIGELASHTGEICGLEWRLDGQLLASGGNDNMVNIWDARSSLPKHTKTDHTSAVKALAWCPWQLSLLATGGGREDQKINFWNTTNGSKLNTINAGSQVTTLIWSRQYKELFSSHGHPNNRLMIWGYPSLTLISEMNGHDDRVLHSALSPDGQTIVTGAADENLKFWKSFESKKKKQLNSGAGQNEPDLSSSFSKMAIR
ncbi:ubiquitin-protein transferase activating protein [Clydaea vesicula]|uniref:Ubiquitin-protein transferase activating protein n=1 Tax=Clydaea vesicula TaxID=447962 RepID=A0AAD5U5W6_9FUNG|nr:ubiquitin-protein transferase activating protein [Clydaea vesicula]